MLVSLVDQASLPAIRLVETFDRCHELNARLVELFRDVRLLVCATTAGVAPANALGSKGTVNGVVDPNWVRLTFRFNMIGSPAATVPAGLSNQSVSVGVLLVGPHHADITVLRAAAALEAAIGFDAQAPLEEAGCPNSHRCRRSRNGSTWRSLAAPLRGSTSLVSRR